MLINATEENLERLKVIYWTGDLRASTPGENIQFLKDLVPGFEPDGPVNGTDILLETYKYDYNAAIELLGLIRDMDPAIQCGLNSPGYRFEMVGYSIFKLAQSFVTDLFEQKMCEDDAIRLYEAINSLRAYSDEKYTSPLHDGGEFINAAAENDYLELFRKSYKKVVFKTGALSIGSIRNLVNNGEVNPVNWIINKLHRTAIQQQTRLFWFHSDDFVKILEKKEINLQTIEVVKDLALHVYGSENLSEYASNIKNGIALKLIISSAKIIDVARKYGYSLTDKDYQAIMHPIEKMAFYCGNDWLNRLPNETLLQLRSMLSSVDKDRLIGKKRNMKLISALNEIMPGEGWVARTDRKSRGKILTQSLDL